MCSASGNYGDIGVSVVSPEARDCGGKIQSRVHIGHPAAEQQAPPPRPRQPPSLPSHHIEHITEGLGRALRFVLGPSLNSRAPVRRGRRLRRGPTVGSALWREGGKAGGGVRTACISGFSSELSIRPQEGSPGPPWPSGSCRPSSRTTTTTTATSPSG